MKLPNNVALAIDYLAVWQRAADLGIQCTSHGGIADEGMQLAAYGRDGTEAQRQMIRQREEAARLKYGSAWFTFETAEAELARIKQDMEI